MASGPVAGADGRRHGFRRIVYLVILLVIVPTALLLALGILMMALGDAQRDIIFGILVVTLVGCLVTGAVLALVFLTREANLSKLQLDFVSKVSHELRTPLTSIRMFAEMLQSGDGQDAEHTRICLATLHKEVARLTERIERLLDWGRMEAGRRRYRLVEDTTRQIAEAALASFETATLGTNRVVELECPDPELTVLADRDAMVDALVNLLANAHKYSPTDKPIRLVCSGDASQARWSVTDEGIGIPRREHRRIFEKFYRVDERLSRAVEGTGLGLAIVSHIAAGHGGRVEVESEPARGSTFTLVLPRHAGRRASPTSESGPGATAPPDPATNPPEGPSSPPSGAERERTEETMRDG